ncbi:MAG: hypothetical protein AB7H80_12525 [Candidatus Kapaibacterium sp.]
MHRTELITVVLILTFGACTDKNSGTISDEFDSVLSASSNTTNKIVFPLSDSTTQEAIGHVVDKLDERCAIDFFDYFHPQISDPGAFVTVHKEGEELKYMLGNHGWTSEWKPITRDSLIEYIYKNRQYNHGQLVLSARFIKHTSIKKGNTTLFVPQHHDIEDKRDP